jgi:hypothetical protein
MTPAHAPVETGAGASPFIRSSRDRRIDRALSAVLDGIADEEENARSLCVTWKDLDILSIRMNIERNRAYDRAATLRRKWRARVNHAPVKRGVAS